MIETTPCPKCGKVEKVHELDGEYYISHLCCSEYAVAAMGKSRDATIRQFNRKMEAKSDD